MKPQEIHFYSPQENREVKKKNTPKPASMTGYISSVGKLVFPAKTVAQLPFDPATTRFRIGGQEGKRKIKSLYLLPVGDSQDKTFKMGKVAKTYVIPLALILQKGGVDYENAKYKFTMKPFEYEGGVTGYELQLSSDAPKTPYTGKPRGRRKTAETA